ncbi:MAG: hypothetical protein ACI9M6_001684 [Hydrogenophaga sp.]
MTIWRDKDMPRYATASGKRGRQRAFSDAAIPFCLSIKCLFGLALRQSLGMVERLFPVHLADVLALAGLTAQSHLQPVLHKPPLDPVDLALAHLQDLSDILAGASVICAL